jgi:hypothetical protein
MKLIASRFAVVLAGTILIAMTVALATSRSDDCGLFDCARPHVNAAAAVDARTPTPAPPQNLVFVRVESDKPDIQVSWSE